MSDYLYGSGNNFNAEWSLPTMEEFCENNLLYNAPVPNELVSADPVPNEPVLADPVPNELVSGDPVPNELVSAVSYSNENTMEFNDQQQPSGSGPEQDPVLNAAEAAVRYFNENTVDFNIQQQPSGSGPEQDPVLNAAVAAVRYFNEIDIVELSLVKQPSGSVSECSTADFQDVYEFDVVPDEELQRFQAPVPNELVSGDPVPNEPVAMDSYSNENTMEFNDQQQPSGSGPEQIDIVELSLVKQPSGSVSECSTADFQDVYEFDVVPDEELQRFQYNNGKLYIRPDIEFHVNVTVKNMGEKPMYLCAFIDSPYQTPVLKHNKTCQNLLSGNTEQMLSLHSCDTNTESVHNDDTGSMNAKLRHVSTKLEPSKMKPFYGYKIVYENNTCESKCRLKHWDIQVIFKLEDEEGYVVGQKKLQGVLTYKPRNAILHAINNNDNASQSTEGSGQTKTVKNKRKIVESKQDMEDSDDSDIPLSVLRKKKKKDNNNQIYIVPSIYVKDRLLFRKLIKTNINKIKLHIAQNNEEDAAHLNANIAVLERGLNSV